MTVPFAKTRMPSQPHGVKTTSSASVHKPSWRVRVPPKAGERSASPCYHQRTSFCEKQRLVLPSTTAVRLPYPDGGQFNRVSLDSVPTGCPNGRMALNLRLRRCKRQNVQGGARGRRARGNAAALVNNPIRRYNTAHYIPSSAPDKYGRAKQ